VMLIEAPIAKRSELLAQRQRRWRQMRIAKVPGLISVERVKLDVAALDLLVALGWIHTGEGDGRAIAAALSGMLSDASARFSRG
jgi:hypothetical protein